MKNEPCSVQLISGISHRHLNAKQKSLGTSRSLGTSLSPRYAKIATAQDKSFSVYSELHISEYTLAPHSTKVQKKSTGQQATFVCHKSQQNPYLDRLTYDKIWIARV